ncbi:MAG: 23S rRNA (guanosine(2251)-2'-O)-methyltransferase RlmB [Chloroflexi bacterium]|nr:23S rRNA (guanosine(2251)-2'-O)-methyltransferase RlmB [Chloroflexota bacterium]
MPEFLYGRRAVLEALRAQRAIEKIFILRDANLRGALGELIAAAQKNHIVVQDVPREKLDAVARDHQGVVAQVAAYQYASVEELLAVAHTRGEPAFLLLLDAVQDPQNFGTLLRTAEAVGIHGVIIAERRAVGVTAAVVKASAGAVEHLKIARVTNLARTIEELKRANVWVIGLENDPRAQELSRVDFSGALALVLGNEGAGLHRLVREQCDFLLRVPMWGKIESLNVAVAGSLVLYHARLQRSG